MLKRSTHLAFLFCCCLAAAWPSPDRADPASVPAAKAELSAKVPFGYKIGAGDVLQIVVWKEPDASVPAVVVRADGIVSVPLVKEVYALGLTLAEFEKLLTDKMSSYIPGADVTVVPREIKSQKVYLIGAVRRVGAIPLQSAMTVLQAITEAGGVNEYAKTKKAYILRRENGVQKRLPFNYSALVKGERIEDNIVLMPDDTIVVPQ